METVTEDRISKLSNFGKIITKHTLDNKEFRRNLLGMRRGSKKAHDNFRENYKRIKPMTSTLTEGFKAAALGVKGFVISVFTNTTMFQMAKEMVVGFIEVFGMLAFNALKTAWVRAGMMLSSFGTQVKSMAKGFFYRVGRFLGMTNEDVDLAIKKMKSRWETVWNQLIIGWQQTWPIIIAPMFGLVGLMAGTTLDASRPFDTGKKKDWKWPSLMATLEGVKGYVTKFDWGIAWDNFKSKFGFTGEVWELLKLTILGSGWNALQTIGLDMGRFLDKTGASMKEGLINILAADWDRLYPPKKGPKAGKKFNYVLVPIAPYTRVGGFGVNVPIYFPDDDASGIDDSWQ